ncbi:hypothetical protein GGI07_001786 [Coemansia sp. Benny D115]|nr:hypothetical protein GGI07_001786 [Coemansia sp. Benny D115]
MSYTQTEHTLNTVRIGWAQRSHIDFDSDSDSDSDSGISESDFANSRSKISNSLGLTLKPGRGRISTLLAESAAQVQSPTVPSGLFFEDAPLPPPPPPSQPPLQPQPAQPSAPMPSSINIRDSEIFIDHNLPEFDFDFAPVLQGGYSLDTSFLKSWNEPSAPPVPKLPNSLRDSYVAQLAADKIEKKSEQNILFPRPGDDSSSEAAFDTTTTGVPHKSPRAKKASRAAEMAAAGAVNIASSSKSPKPRSVSTKQPVSYPKRNYSMPAALAQPAPRLEMESYEFACIERLERKWEDVKTESTRVLSSAIYKYYFNHGEWGEFEQVFPNKVLEVWEDFQEKLSSAERTHLNSVLVSQNPFSSESAAAQEKHIPLLARTIPLSQAVRTMVYSEEMRSRESYSSQGSNGPEIDPEFSDWLISRFNSLKTSAGSPSSTTFAETKAKRQSQLPAGNASSTASTREVQKRVVTAPAASAASVAAALSMAPPMPAIPIPTMNPAVFEMRSEIVPISPTDMIKKPKKKSGSLHASKSMSEGEKPRRKKTVNGAKAPEKKQRSVSQHNLKDEAAAAVTRRPSMGDLMSGEKVKKTVKQRPVTAVPSSHLNAAESGSAADLPSRRSISDDAAKLTRKGSKSRRHTHTFFTSESNEFVVPSDSLRLNRRITRELQMKDLPPLPPNAAEIGELARVTRSATKKSGVISHFSSHIELGRVKEVSMDKPRSHSISTDVAKPRPSTAGPSLVDSRTSKSSVQSNEVAYSANYEWRDVPVECDGESWGFRISHLVFHEPMVQAKVDTASYVVHAYQETMNRRKLPDPKKDVEVKMPPMPAMPSVTPPVTATPMPVTPTPAMPPMPVDIMKESVGAERQKPVSSSKSLRETRPKTPQNPERRANRPQSKLGLGLGAGAVKKPTATSKSNGVRGVLYELAYLSTQSKAVWSKSEHIFEKMLKAGLEVNRIAEQDFYDFCVDELLKASMDAFHDLQAMGNKTVAKQLFESFNAKLSILLNGTGRSNSDFPVSSTLLKPPSHQQRSRSATTSVQGSKQWDQMFSPKSPPLPNNNTFTANQQFSHDEWQEKVGSAMFGSYRGRQEKKKALASLEAKSLVQTPVKSSGIEQLQLSDPVVHMLDDSPPPKLIRFPQLADDIETDVLPLQRNLTASSTESSMSEGSEGGIGGLNELLFAANSKAESETRMLVRMCLKDVERIYTITADFDEAVSKVFRDFAISALELVRGSNGLQEHPSNMHSRPDSGFHDSSELSQELRRRGISEVKYSEEQMRRYAATGLCKYVTSQVLLSTGIENDLADKLAEASEGLHRTMQQIAILSEIGGEIQDADSAALHEKARLFRENMAMLAQEQDEAGRSRETFETVLLAMQEL